MLGELEGVSEETLERIDHVSRPSADGPVPRYPQDVMLYERLVLLALAENAWLGSKRAAQRRQGKQANLLWWGCPSHKAGGEPLSQPPLSAPTTSGL